MAMDNPDFGTLMRVAMEAAGGVRSAHFCWCWCGGLLAGVVVAGSDVIALACPQGHRVMRVCCGVCVEARNNPDKPTDEILGGKG
jgi:hypothetical protein